MHLETKNSCLMPYIPSSELLEKYSEVLVWFALWSWKWISAWDVVMIRLPESAKPLLPYLQRSILTRWGHPLIQYLPNDLKRDFYEMASSDQVAYMPHTYMLWMAEDINHLISIVADNNKRELEWIDPEKIMNRTRAGKFFSDAIHEKEHAGNFTWTVWLYGTDAMAKEVWLTLEQYREQIIFACYLDEANPIQKRHEVMSVIEQTKDWLNSLPIEYLHVRWEDVDLKVAIWPNRQWLWWTGRNVPSFEVFVSPDWRWTEGWIKCNQPLYRYGSLITDIELEFSDWIVVDAKASSNEHLLKEMIQTENADKLWEFSLTDRRLSRITQFMWETLYDENVWWPFWNTHIALWMAYKDSFPWDISSVTEQEWSDMGYNDSPVHTDIVSTTDRTVIAYLADWREIMIYKEWEFLVS